jgi:hypothetical protein
MNYKYFAQIYCQEVKNERAFNFIHPYASRHTQMFLKILHKKEIFGL